MVWTGLVGDVDSSVCGTILCVGDNRLHDRAKTPFGLYFIWYLLVLNIFLICSYTFGLTIFLVQYVSWWSDNPISITPD